MMKKFLFITFLMLAFTNVGMCESTTGIGETSTGTMDISLTIPRLIVISGLNDVTFGTLEVTDVTTNGLDTNQDICVTSNLHSGENYYVTAKAFTPQAESSFVLRRAATQNGSDDTASTIAYTVSFKNGTGTSGGTELTHGTKTAFEYTSSTYDADGALFAPDCNSGEKNANVRIQISKETLYAAYYGAYSGTLQLFVEPD